MACSRNPRLGTAKGLSTYVRQEANIFFSLFVSERLGFADAARGLATQYTGDAEKADASELRGSEFTGWEPDLAVPALQGQLRYLFTINY